MLVEVTRTVLLAVGFMLAATAPHPLPFLAVGCVYLAVFSCLGSWLCRDLWMPRAYFYMSLSFKGTWRLMKGELAAAPLASSKIQSCNTLSASMIGCSADGFKCRSCHIIVQALQWPCAMHAGASNVRSHQGAQNNAAGVHSALV